MYKKTIVSLWLLALGLCSFGATSGYAEFRERTPAVKPEKSVVPPGYDPRHIEVKFLDQQDIGLSAEGVPYDRADVHLKSTRAATVFAAIADAGGEWTRMPALPEQEIDRLRETAEQNLQRGIADLNNYFTLTVPDGVVTEEWLEQLNSLDDVEIALAMPLPMPAPAVPGNFEGSQGYLTAAPNGIDAYGAWAAPGAVCLPFVCPVRICDFEYSWNLNHQDLPSVWYTHDPLYTPSDPFSDDNHGTAVLGELGSLNNGWGTTGASFNMSIDASPTYLNGAWQLGVAMTWMLSAYNPGDVFLIEQQIAGPNYTGGGGSQDGLIPVEWWQSWYNIILTAIGNGIHVVMAAGNGREDLDDPIYATGNGGHWPFLPANHSGAIVVGAGAAPGAYGGSDVDRSRMWFSNWGSRVDLQGWGEAVMTIGYGNYYSAEGKDLWYTNSFSGTSSASPIVGAAVVLLEAVYENQHGGPMPPAQARTLLVATGAPQQAGTYPISQQIGPRPDLGPAMAAILTCCVIRGDVDHSGSANISDITYLVDFFFRAGPAPPCGEEADVDASGSANISDLTYLVDFLFRAGPPPPPC